jgi:formylglycine-generating enzyme required for sulfatase activity/serine/threonine protein kinase
MPEPNWSKTNPEPFGADNATWLRLEPGAEPLAGYRLVRERGRGGFGDVWQAVGPDSQPLALKFMRLTSNLPAAESAFLKLLQDIRHPHLLPVYWTKQRPGYLIVAMELADCTLMDRHTQAVAQGEAGIPFAELVRYMEEAAAGIDHLNEVQHVAPDETARRPVLDADGQDDFRLRLGTIQHRDIKPQNLFLVGGRVKVADFGLAKFSEHTVTKHSGAVTVAYAPPEFFQGETTIGSDQYSLAVSYCQLRGGRLPFIGTPAQIMAGHLNRPPDLTMVPAEERLTLERALAKKPEERWPSCRAFVTALGARHVGEGALLAPVERLPSERLAVGKDSGLLVPAVAVAARNPSDMDQEQSRGPMPSRGGKRWPMLMGTAGTAAFLSTLALVGITWWYTAKATNKNSDLLDSKKLVAEDPLIRDMKFVKVPKGTFWMGWDSEQKQSKQVPIAEDFELAAYTVTQEQWEKVMGKNPSWFSRQGEGKEAVKHGSDADLKRFPVESVSWEDAQEFLKKLNEREKAGGWLYRLPTEAEWEYACRGGATSQEECSYDFYFEQPTNDLSSKQANFDGNVPAGKAEKGSNLNRPTKVGSYAPNKLGLYDMHGNVLQWCEDLLFEGGPDRVIRGGCWGSYGQSCRAALRSGSTPANRYYALGLRVARVPSGMEDALIRDMNFVKVPKGTFWMSKDGKNAQQQVEIKQDFELAAYTVTQEQWATLMGNNPSRFSRNGEGKEKVKHISDADLKRFPVDKVSWDDVQEFLKKLNKREQGKGWLYRLPTEAEWEYACRGAATTKEECSFDFYFDKPTNDLSSKEANLEGVYDGSGPFLGRTTKVGSYAPNKLGLYDMHGNICQWCSDLYDDGTGLLRVYRGGCWCDSRLLCRAAYRDRLAPSERSSLLGFRIARVPTG